MRIVHVMGYYQSGLGYQENWLPFEQRALGHDVALVCADRLWPVPNFDETLGRIVDSNGFQDAVGFLQTGGQRGRRGQLVFFKPSANNLCRARRRLLQHGH